MGIVDLRLVAFTSRRGVHRLVHRAHLGLRTVQRRFAGVVLRHVLIYSSRATNLRVEVWNERVPVRPVSTRSPLRDGRGGLARVLLGLGDVCLEVCESSLQLRRIDPGKDLPFSTMSPSRAMMTLIRPP